MILPGGATDICGRDFLRLAPLRQQYQMSFGNGHLNCDSYDQWLDPGMNASAASDLLNPYDVDAVLSGEHPDQSRGERRRGVLAPPWNLHRFGIGCSRCAAVVLTS